MLRKIKYKLYNIYNIKLYSIVFIYKNIQYNYLQIRIIYTKMYNITIYKYTIYLQQFTIYTKMFLGFFEIFEKHKINKRKYFWNFWFLNKYK